MDAVVRLCANASNVWRHHASRMMCSQTWAGSAPGSLRSAAPPITSQVQACRVAGGHGGAVGRRWRWRCGACDCAKNWVMHVCMVLEWCCRPFLLRCVQDRAAAGGVTEKRRATGSQPVAKKRRQERHKGETETKEFLEKNGQGTTLSAELCRLSQFLYYSARLGRAYTTRPQKKNLRTQKAEGLDHANLRQSPIGSQLALLTRWLRDTH